MWNITQTLPGSDQLLYGILFTYSERTFLDEDEDWSLKIEKKRGGVSSFSLPSSKENLEQPELAGQKEKQVK